MSFRGPAGPKGQARKTLGDKSSSAEIKEVNVLSYALLYFHEVSRAAGPSRQARKTLGDKSSSAEIKEVNVLSYALLYFHEVSRAAGPSRQGRKNWIPIGSPRAVIDPGDRGVSVKMILRSQPNSFLFASQTHGTTRDARLAHYFKELRYARGWAQERPAKPVGVSRQSLNSIECDR